MQVLGGRGSDLERSFSYGWCGSCSSRCSPPCPAEERADLLAGSAALAAPLFDRPGRGGAGRGLVAGDAPRSLLADGEPRRAPAPARARRAALVRSALVTLAGLPPATDGGPRPLGHRRPPAGGTGRGSPPELIGQIVSDPLATTVRPAPLSTGAVARLLRESLSPEADDAFCAACQGKRRAAIRCSCVSSCT